MALGPRGFKRLNMLACMWVVELSKLWSLVRFFLSKLWSLVRFFFVMVPKGPEFRDPPTWCYRVPLGLLRPLNPKP